MGLEERVAREKKAHDGDGVLEEAYRLKERFSHVGESFTMRRCNKALAEDIRLDVGEKMLEIGCGFGDQCLEGLKQGAIVAGIDISDRHVNEATGRARAMGYPETQWEFRVMDAHALEYKEGMFDLVFGKGILHHLDLERGVAEVHRVLKVGGKGIFLEPLADNPMLKIFRWLTPKARTIDEQPLRRIDLAMLASKYSIQMRFYGLVSAPLAMITSVALRPWPNNFLLKWADWLDERLSRFQTLGPMSQYVVLTIRK